MLFIGKILFYNLASSFREILRDDNRSEEMPLPNTIAKEGINSLGTYACMVHAVVVIIIEEIC